MKYLLLLALFLFVVWKWRQRRSSRRPMSPPAARAPERMVKCEYCGVNQPFSESVVVNGHYFCSPDHRKASGVTGD